MIGGARCLFIAICAYVLRQVLAHDSRRAETSRNFAAFRTGIGRSHAACDGLTGLGSDQKSSQ